MKTVDLVVLIDGALVFSFDQLMRAVGFDPFRRVADIQAAAGGV